MRAPRPIVLSESDIARFWPRVNKNGPNGCWEWTGALNNYGYGAFSIGRPMYPAHRVAYVLILGPVPSNHPLDHLCRNRKCVNPDHLDAVPQKINMQRGWWGTKEHCIHGHLYTPENTYVATDGHRTCRTCRKEKWDAWYLTHKKSAA